MSSANTASPFITYQRELCPPFRSSSLREFSSPPRRGAWKPGGGRRARGQTRCRGGYDRRKMFCPARARAQAYAGAAAGCPVWRTGIAPGASPGGGLGCSGLHGWGNPLPAEPHRIAGLEPNEICLKPPGGSGLCAGRGLGAPRPPPPEPCGSVAGTGKGAPLGSPRDRG